MTPGPARPAQGALLAATGICKRFPGVVALDDVSLDLRRGEVLALLGENGAGKSTLLKILSGAQSANEGRIVLDGRELAVADSPAARQSCGIVTIYQELNLIPTLTVAENMYVGREPVRGGFIQWRKLFEDAQGVLKALGVGIDARAEIRTLSIGEQQMVEIAKALTLDAKVIIMDEPSAALSAREVLVLHDLVRALAARGLGVIYVTHRLNEVEALCDRLTVLRDGRLVATHAVKDTGIEDMVRLMVGRTVEFLPRVAGRAPGRTVLEVRGVSRTPHLTDTSSTHLRDISLSVREGEIVGFAGLVGSGRTELARIIFGADRFDAGEILVAGRPLVPLETPRDAIEAGIALLTEDRKAQGCFLEHSIRQNMTLPILDRLSDRAGFIDRKAEATLVEGYRQKFAIKMVDGETPIGKLSGGNQQKVLLARCIALAPKLLIVDEPTRGIDINAKGEVHRALFALADEGMAIIVISSELPEVMAVSDRIVTFREGCVTGTFPSQEATEEGLMRFMAFGASGEAGATEKMETRA